MKIKKGLMLRSVGGVNMVVAVGDMAARFKGIVRLNETGVFLWKQLESDSDESALVTAMTEQYDVEEDVAKRDVAAFIEKMRQVGFLDE